MKIWSTVKKALGSVKYRYKKKKHGLTFPLYCKIHGVKHNHYQGALAQSQAQDKLQIVHTPTQKYPYNVYVYSVTLNRVLGYLHKDLSKKLVKVFGKGFCRDALIKNLTGGRAVGYKYLGCNIQILESMRHMIDEEDFLYLHGV